MVDNDRGALKESLQKTAGDDGADGTKLGAGGEGRERLGMPRGPFAWEDQGESGPVVWLEKKLMTD